MSRHNKPEEVLADYLAENCELRVVATTIHPTDMVGVACEYSGLGAGPARDLDVWLNGALSGVGLREHHKGAVVKRARAMILLRELTLIHGNDEYY